MITGSAIAGIIAAVLLALSLIIFRSHWSRNNLLLGLVLCLCALLEFFDLLTFLSPASSFFWKNASLFCEALLPSIWTFFILAVTGFPTTGSRRLFSYTVATSSLLFLIVVLVVSVDNFYFNPDFSHESILFLRNLGHYFYFALVLFLTYPLVLLERLYSSLDQQARWAVKFELVGIGTIIASQLFYYSQGLLYRSLDFSFLPVRSIGLFIGISLIFYSLRRKKHIPQVVLSRRVANRSLVILVVGIYFLSLGLAGEGMRYLGPYSLCWRWLGPLS